jgi:PAS domain S-box-containing protein
MKGVPMARKKTVPGDLRKLAEEKARLQGSDAAEKLSPGETQRLIHELRVHQIQLEMQNEELQRAQAELALSKLRYFDLFDLAPVGYMTVSEQGIITESNLTAATMLGTARNELEKAPFTRFIHNDDHDIYYLHRKHLFETGIPQVCELRLARADGSTIWARAEAAAALEGESGRQACKVILSDITEHKREHDQLLKTNERLEFAQRSAGMGTWDWDMTSGKLEWSAGLLKLFGLPSAGPAPSFDLWRSVVHPLDRQAAEERINSAVEEHVPLSNEYRIVRPGGEERWIWSLGNTVYDLSGRALRMSGICIDITARKRAEEALRHNQAMLARTEGVAHVGSWEWDVATDTVTWSDELFRIFQLDPADGAPSFAEHPKFYDPEDMQRLTAAVKDAVSHGAPYELELRAIRKDGMTRVCLARGQAEMGREGRVVHLFGSLQDITELKQAEEDLRKSEINFRELFDSVTSGVAIYEVRNDGLSGKDYIIKDFNKRSLQIEGRQKEDVIGKSLFDLRPAIDEYGLISVFRSVWKTGVPQYYPQKIYIDEKYSNYYENHVFRLPSGKIVAVYNDITESKRAEEALRESEERYRNIFNNAIEGIFQTTAAGRYRTINPSFARMFGYCSPEEMISAVTNIGEQLYVNPEDRLRLIELMSAKGEMVTNFEVELLRKDRSRFWVSINAAMVRNVENGVPFIEGTCADITELKRAKEALRESDRRFIDVIYASSDAILLIDSNRFVDCNEATAKMLGYKTREEFLQSHPSELSPPVQPDGRKSVEKADDMMRIALEKGFHRFEWIHRRANGEDFPVEVSLTPVVYKGKSLLYCVWRDVSENKLIEHEKQKLADQLQQAMKMEAIGRLAGGVAHDFNNLLTGITGNVSLALMDLDPADPLHSTLEEVNKAAERAGSLTGQLLAFSRKQIIEPRTVNLGELVSNLNKMLVRIIGEDINLKITPAKDLMAVKIDPGQFGQVIVNLAVNARDAMPDGGNLFIETANAGLDEEYCKTRTYLSPGRYVMLAVKDTGHGMSDDVKSHLFEPFFTTKPMGRGTGLGLATLYGIVKQAGGFIEVESEIGRGTTFRIYLPPVEEKAEMLGTGPGSPEVRGGDETIMVVEDELMLRDMAVKMITRMGYKALGAPDGKTALALAKGFSDRIDLLLTDVIMPGMNGRQLAEGMKRIHPEISVLYMSGYTDDILMEHGMNQGDFNFISKPYTPKKLSMKLREVLDRK